MVRVIQCAEEFDEILKGAGNKVVLVDFYADWCGPCRAFAPILETLATEWPNVVFLKVNTDEVPELASKYRISALPTFIFFKNGSKMDTVTGANKGKVLELLNALSTYM